MNNCCDCIRVASFVFDVTARGYMAQIRISYNRTSQVFRSKVGNWAVIRLWFHCMCFNSWLLRILDNRSPQKKEDLPVGPRTIIDTLHIKTTSAERMRRHQSSHRSVKSQWTLEQTRESRYHLKIYLWFNLFERLPMVSNFLIPRRYWLISLKPSLAAAMALAHGGIWQSRIQKWMMISLRYQGRCSCLKEMKECDASAKRGVTCQPAIDALETKQFIIPPLHIELRLINHALKKGFLVWVDRRLENLYEE